MHNARRVANGQPPPAGSGWRLPPGGGQVFAGLDEIYRRKLPN